MLALHNALSPILAGIFAGNGVVVKCSENVVWSTQWFVDAVKECLRICGQDPELVQVCCSFREMSYDHLNLLMAFAARVLLPRRGGCLDQITMDQTYNLHRI